DGFGVGGIELQHGHEALRRAADIAEFQALGGLFEQRCDLFFHAGAAETVDEELDLAFRDDAHEAIDRPALIERVHGRDRAHAELAGDSWILVDIDLHQFHFAGGTAHGAFERRPELAAGAAPRGPEIDDHRLL